MNEVIATDWESICTRCGKCCYFIVDGERSYSEPCRFLDTGTNLCTVYEERDKVPWCTQLTPENVASDLIRLPGDCAYKTNS